ncbi:MAG: DUF393 domain-containing protein [Pseudomonadota bacterium]
MSNVTVVYDGECPLCRNACLHLQLRHEFADLELVDARVPGVTMDDLSTCRIDLDQGMVVLFENECYQGSDAVHLLSQLTNREGFFNRLLFVGFRSKLISKAMYPLLKGIRILALWVSNVAPINNVKAEQQS